MMKRHAISALLVLACAGQLLQAQPGCSAVAALSVASSFANQSTVPKQFTADGEDKSPPLSWNGVPKTAKSIAVYVEDPDAPSGTWYHWLLWNLSANAKGLAEGVPKTASLPGGALQGTNDFDKIGYNGPAPPHGKLHHYVFNVLALDSKLQLPTGAKKDEFLAAINNHVIAKGTLIGTYQR